MLPTIRPEPFSSPAIWYCWRVVTTKYSPLLPVSLMTLRWPALGAVLSCVTAVVCAACIPFTSGTIPNQWNQVLLLRDLDRLISDGRIERLRNVREVYPDPRDKTWYRKTATGNLYVYVTGWERGSPEFRRDTIWLVGELHL